MPDNEEELAQMLARFDVERQPLESLQATSRADFEQALACLELLQQIRPARFTPPPVITPPSADAVRELLHREIQLRREIGAPSALSEYAQQFPELDSLLRAVGANRAQAGSPAANVDVPVPAIPDLDLLGELGRGGMSVVYLARQRSLNRLVALKILPGALAAAPDRRARFQAEAEAIARLQHPNIIQIHATGWAGAEPYLLLELASGGSLADKVRGQPQPEFWSADLVARLAQALQAVHDAGFVHRDLKPGNIFLQLTLAQRSADPDAWRDLTTTIPKLGDFGLARNLVDELERDTKTGQILGTPQYMAPEQASGESAVTSSADIWALGVILYELLTGRPPFQATTPLATMRLVQTQEPLAPGRLQPGMSRDLETIALKCLEKDPRRRYSSARELAEDLHRFRDGRPILARPIGITERLWRWVKREPAKGGLIGTIAGSVLVGIAGLLVFTAYLNAAYREAETQKGVAQTKEGEARKEAEVARLARLDAERQTEQTRLANYAYQVRFVQFDLRATPWPARFVHLDETRAELRGWEYHWLARHYQRNVAEFGTNRGAFTAVAYSPDGRSIACVDAKGRLYLWEPARGTAREIEGHAGTTVKLVAWSDDATRLISGDINGTLRIWDAVSGRELRSVQFPADRLEIAAWRPGTRELLIALLDDVVSLNIDTGKQSEVVLRNGGMVRSLCFSPDGKTLAMAGHTRSIRLFEAATLKPQTSLNSPLGEVEHLAWGTDSRTLAVGGHDGRVAVWRLPGDKPLSVLQADTNAVFSLAVIGTDSVVATYSEENLRVWRLSDPKPIKPSVHIKVRTGPSCSHPSRPLVAIAELTGVRLWNVEPVPGPTLLSMSYTEQPPLVLRPDGAMLAANGPNHAIRLWNPEDRRELFDLPGHRQPVTDLAFSPNGDYLFSASADNTIVRWNMAERKVVMRYDGHKSRVNRLSLSSDGRLLASIGDNGRLHVREVETGTLTCSFTVRAVALAFDPAGEVIATGDLDGTVRLHNCRTSESITLVAKSDRMVTHLRWSPDGDTLLLTGASFPPALYDRKGVKLREFKGNANGLFAVTVDWRGGRVFGATPEQVFVWNLHTGEELLSIGMRLEQPSRVVYVPQHRKVFVAGAGGVYCFDGVPNSLE